jgi:hypothetical protein
MDQVRLGYHELFGIVFIQAISFGDISCGFYVNIAIKRLAGVRRPCCARAHATAPSVSAPPRRLHDLAVVRGALPIRSSRRERAPCRAGARFLGAAGALAPAQHRPPRPPAPPGASPARSGATSCSTMPKPSRRLAPVEPCPTACARRSRKAASSIARGSHRSMKRSINRPSTRSSLRKARRRRTNKASGPCRSRGSRRCDLRRTRRGRTPLLPRGRRRSRLPPRPTPARARRGGPPPAARRRGHSAHRRRRREHR